MDSQSHTRKQNQLHRAKLLRASEYSSKIDSSRGEVENSSDRRIEKIAEENSLLQMNQCLSRSTLVVSSKPLQQCQIIFYFLC